MDGLSSLLARSSSQPDDNAEGDASILQPLSELLAEQPGVLQEGQLESGGVGLHSEHLDPNATLNPTDPSVMSAFADGAMTLNDFNDPSYQHASSFVNEPQNLYGTPDLSQRNMQPGMEGDIGGLGHIRASSNTGMAPAKKGDKDHAPAWSEMKTKAGKERKRLPLACIACRRKKIRCSGEKPACKHCLRSRIPCVYKVTTRKAAPRTDYMAMLDKRLKRMEERVIRIIPKDEQSAVVGNTRAIVKPALPGTPSKASKDVKKRTAEEAFAGDVDKWAESKDIKQEGGEAPIRPQQPETEESSLLKVGAENLPSLDLQEHLAEVFFDYVYGQAYFLLHKPSFMRKLKAGQLPPVLILCVCAMAARFSTHPAVRTEPAFLRGENWAAPAREIALKRYDKPNITILICYLILGLHEFGTCQGGRSWMFGGMAQRMAYALQLHKELEHENWGKDQAGKPQQPRLSSTDQEIRRRTMWSCYMMDRFTSSGTDRPLFMWEKYIKVQLPIKESYFQMETPGVAEDMHGDVPDAKLTDDESKKIAKENTGLPGYTVRAAAIWGRVLDYMNFNGRESDEHPLWDERSGFQNLLRKAREFKKSIPPWFAYTPDNLQVHSSEKTANQFIFLHIFAHQNILFLNRFALPSALGPSTIKDAPEKFLTETTKAALEAANQVSALLVDALEHRVVAPFVGYCAFLSSTVHIHLIFSKNAKLEGEAKKNLAINVKYLSKIKRYWGMFHFVTEQLKDQYRQQADSNTNGNSRKGSGIFQYGDWFDRYPSGVSSTDFEDPAAEGKKEPGTDAVMSQKSEVQSMEDFFATLSPDSKRAHLQKAAKKRKQAKSVSENSRQKPTSQPTEATPSTVHQVQPIQTDIGISAVDPVFATTPDYFAPSHFPEGSNVDWAALAQQANFYPESSRMVTALDRQLVMSSLSGFDTVPTGLTPPAMSQQAMLNTQIPQATQPSQHRDSATNALVQAQVRAQAQVQAQARLQQQQRQNQQQPGQTPTADWSNWDVSLDMQAPFDMSMAGFGSGMDMGGTGTAWFMPFNLQPPDLGGINGNAAAQGMWDYVFAGSEDGPGTSSNSGIGGMDIDEDVGGLNTAFSGLGEEPVERQGTS